MKSQIEKHIPAISANTVKLYLIKKGYPVNFDFRNAKLGNYFKGINKTVQHEDYHVLIACCSNNNIKWVCIAENTIPQNTSYILECEPRANIVTLWNLMDLQY
jgi:hypothetical protein